MGEGPCYTVDQECDAIESVVLWYMITKERTKTKPETSETEQQTLPGTVEMRRSIRAMSRSKLHTRAMLLIALILILTLATVYAVSMLKTRSGSFVISALNKEDSLYAISLSETAAFLNPTTRLNSGAIEGMDNITYSWLPEDLETQDGGHNGENYIAYSFYMGNTGQRALDYEGKLLIDYATLHIDEAVRIMVIKNGERTIYACPQQGSDVPEPDTVAFTSSTVAMTTRTENMEPGTSDHYTVVIWLEGEDPQCVDSVKGGRMGMRMEFRVLNDTDNSAGEDESK